MLSAGRRWIEEWKIELHTLLALDDRRNWHGLLNGLAWAPGMLRRSLYPDTNIYLPYMTPAMFFGILIAIGFLAFLINLIKTYGVKTLLGLFIPQK